MIWLCIIADTDCIPGEEYKGLPDEQAEKDGLIRIIDESGEDYLHPRIYFMEV